MAFRQEPDLVQEEHAAVRGLEESLSRLPCLAVRATHEAEELRFAESLGDGPAIDRDEGRARPWTGQMKGTREQPLASSGLALDEHRRQTPTGAGPGEHLSGADLHLLEDGTAAQEFDHRAASHRGHVEEIRPPSSRPSSWHAPFDDSAPGRIRNATPTSRRSMFVLWLGYCDLPNQFRQRTAPHGGASIYRPRIHRLSPSVTF